MQIIYEIQQKKIIKHDILRRTKEFSSPLTWKELEKWLQSIQDKNFRYEIRVWDGEKLNEKFYLNWLHTKTSQPLELFFYSKSLKQVSSHL